MMLISGRVSSALNVLWFMGLAGHVLCGKRVALIPAGTGKVTRKLVQGRTPGSKDLHHLFEVCVF